MLRDKALWGYLVAGVLVSGLAACGGSGGPPTGGTPVVTQPPTPPPPTVIAQRNGYRLPVLNLGDIGFTTTSVGTVEAVVDWTLASNDVDVYITRTCTFEQFIAEQCTVLAFSESTTAKPERPRAANVPAGSYTLWIGNVGPTEESISFQVVFTANAAGGGAPGAASLPAGPGPAFGKGRLQGVVGTR